MRKLNLSKVAIGVASLVLSAGVWAADPVSDLFETTARVAATPIHVWQTDGVSEPADYMVTDATTNTVRYLDGVEQGREVSDQGNTMYDGDCMKGDTITDLKTNKSGVITGIKEQGTMDVVAPSGNTVRYQYVEFYVNPL
jgi:hypothetical protein